MPKNCEINFFTWEIRESVCLCTVDLNKFACVIVCVYVCVCVCVCEYYINLDYDIWSPSLCTTSPKAGQSEKEDKINFIKSNTLQSVHSVTYINFCNTSGSIFGSNLP